MNNLKIMPLDKTIEVFDDKDLFTALKENDIFIKSSCGGCASCSHCIITVLDGQDNLNEVSFEEKQILGNTFHMTGERLSCQAKLTGDVTIDVSMHGHVAIEKPKPKLRKRAEVQEIREERFQNKKEKPKKLGGGRKPAPFNFINDEHSDNDDNKESK